MRKNNMKLFTKLSALLLLLTGSVAVSAADIQVQVSERGGKAPLVGVAVCLGTSARVDQFGAKLTDQNGYAVFSDVPRTTILVTASGSGYKAEQETMVTSTSNRRLVMSLPTGGGGVQCPLGQPVTGMTGSGLSISRLAMNSGAEATATRSVTLDNVVKGQPTQYRASERADFMGAEWQDYSGAPVFNLSVGNGKKTVYFQVRRHATLNGAKLETLSPARPDSIRLQ
jgi:hypothetical protein